MPSSEVDQSTKPLAGLRVLDLTRVLAGPWATQTLADLGADVIKVERAGNGDDSRSFGPPFLNPADCGIDGASAMFLAANRGKRSVGLDLASPTGGDEFRRLVADADILIENFKVGTMARMGFAPDQLREINPRLIVCSITGYGQTGPYSARGGYDPVIQGLCGLMSVTGKPTGEPGGGPVKTGPSLVDLITGLYATIALLAAVRERDSTGKGCDIDMSLLDCGVAMVAQQMMYYQLTGTPPGPIGNNANGGVPGGGYDCVDGQIIIAPGNDAGYARMCRALGHPELANDPRFVANSSRLAHKRELLALFEPIIAQWTVAELSEVLTAHDVPNGPVNDLSQVVADPQVDSRGLLTELEGVSGFYQIAGPIVINGRRMTSDVPPPALDNHASTNWN